MGLFKRKKNIEPQVETKEVEEVESAEPVDGKIQKVSFNEIESYRTQDPEKINDAFYGKKITVFEKLSRVNPDLEIISGDKITSELIHECIEKIDRIYYTINLGIKDYIEKLVLSHPDLCFIAVNKDTKEVVAYLYCFAMTERATVNFLLGNINFENMKDDMFASSDSEGLINLNISEIAVIPEYQKNSTYNSLFSAFVSALAEKARKNIFVNYMFLEISNVFEREIANAMKFKITTDKYERKVAGNVFNPKNFIAISTSQELVEAYSTGIAKKFMKLQQNYNYLFDEE